MGTVYSVNARTLAEFSCLTGDLSGASEAAARMREGTQGHQLIQSESEPGAQNEAPVSLDAECEGLRFRVRGRIDRLAEGGTPRIDEIKTTRLDPGALTPDAFPVHWAQAEVYAHIVCCTRGAARAQVRLIYVNARAGRAVFSREYSAAALKARFEELLTPYARHVRAREEHLSLARRSMREMNFPFEGFRAGQREMARNVYVALRDGKNLLCQAPTGTGKTAAALFGALRAVGEGYAQRVFYLTARQSTRSVAEEALARMREKGLVARTITLTAKEKICPCPGCACDGASCPRARGYFDRLRGALDEAERMSAFRREAVEDLAGRHALCPFELSLEMSQLCDVVVCDYNYAFDPRVRLKRFFQEKSAAALLADEAHNLPDRAREMFSGAARERDFVRLRRETGRALGRKHALYRALGEAVKSFRALRETIEGGACLDEPPQAFLEAMESFAAEAQARLGQGLPMEGELAERLFDALALLRAREAYGADFRTLLVTEGKSLLVRLWCFNPARLLDEVTSRVRAGVFFSATLSPMEHYFDLLGLSRDKGDAALSLPSPFPRENLLALCLNIDTRYRARAATVRDVAGAILDMCRARNGNYMACFPSYAYLELVRPLLERDGRVRLLAQSADMDEAARARFLAAFDEPAGKDSLLALTVMGGLFTEGVDLPGDKLIGAAIVSTGVPQICFERDQLRALADCAGSAGAGYRLAYTYPGVARVLQAAGRVIRTPTDRGVLLLIDSRFSGREMRALLPDYWQIRPSPGGAALLGTLRAFWAEN